MKRATLMVVVLGLGASGCIDWAGALDAGCEQVGLCGSEPAPDGGPADSGPADSGTPDGGSDAGLADAGGADSGLEDAGTADAGSDAGNDAGTDAGQGDAGSDAGMSEMDAGSDAGADAGTPDAGAFDSGCNATHMDCNFDAGDGCETDITTLDNCGGCGLACGTPAHGTAACSGGTCAVQGCDVGYADCDRQFGNGCESYLATDANNCNGCGNACPPLNNTTGPFCSNGGCIIGGCQAGYGDCDGQVSTGCEASFAVDKQHCGNCFTSCAFNCVNGFCI